METINKKIVSFVIAFIAIFVLIFACYHFWTAVNVDNIKSVQIREQTIKVELALNEEAQERGLSDRKELKENEGMLFVFSEEGKHDFWMKDMNFPIDMVWMDESKIIIYIEDNTKPESYPDSYGPAALSRYVLEVNAGVSEKNNWKVGDEVKFLY